MQRNFMFLMSALVVFSLLFAPAGSAQAQDPHPPRGAALPTAPTQIPPLHGTGVTGDTGRGIVYSAPEGVTQNIIAAPVSLGQPGLSYRYAQMFGETAVAYLEDTDHLNYPFGIGSDGNSIWISELWGNRALKYTNTGIFQQKLGVSGVGEFNNTSFGELADVAVDGSGNTWVVDEGNAHIAKFDASGNLLNELGIPWERGADNAHFETPVSIAFDGNDNIYVSDGSQWWTTDYGNHRIQIFNSSGDYLATLGETYVAGSDNSHFQGLKHIAVYGNQLFVADGGNHRIQIFNITNPVSPSYVATIGESSVSGSDNDHFGNPCGVAVDADYIYVADSWNNRVQVFNRSTRAYFTTIGTGWGNGDYEFGLPFDVDLDSAGNLYVADFVNTRVQQFSRSGNSWVYIRTYGATNVPYLTDNYHYNVPSGVAVAGDGSIYLTEDMGHRLVKLDAFGNPIWTVGLPGVKGDWDDGDYRLDNPADVALDSAGRIYVADRWHSRIQIYNPDGTFYKKITSLDCPGGVTVAPNGNIYVTDSCSQTVKIFNSSLSQVAVLGVPGVPGSDNVHFTAPEDVAVDSRGYIYVADQANQRIQVFNSSRVYLRTMGVLGECEYAFDHFCNPNGLFVDSSNRLYVADQDNNRIQVFDANGAYLASISGNWGTNPSQLRNSMGVGVDSQGNVYVADSGNDRIQKFAPGFPGWKQANFIGFGNPRNTMPISLEVFNNYLYVGTANFNHGTFHLWRTADGQNWEEIDHDFQTGISALSSFNNMLFAATWIGNIWSSSDGINWTNVYTTPDGQGFASFSQYGNTLYAGTYSNSADVGTRILQTTNGVNWTDFVTNGNGDPNAGGTISSATFNGNHYFGIGDWSGVQGARIWRFDGTNLTTVVDDGFGDSGNYSPGGMVTFHGKLYVSVSNPVNTFQVWSSSSGDAGSWSKNFEGGVGEPGDKSRTGLIVFHNQLYLTAQNDLLGMQVWRTTNGAQWNLISDAGFGDSSNTTTEWSSSLKIFNNNLYLGVQNYASGGKIWRTNLPIDVAVGGTTMGSYYLSKKSSVRESYDGLNNGPVVIKSSDSSQLIPSERIIYKYNGESVSYAELTGFPSNQLTNKYWFPWYNNVNMWTQLRFANPSTSLTANVKVYLGTQLLWSYDLGPSASVRKDFAGVNGGPLRIESSINIIAAERVIYSQGGAQRGVETSYSEMMAFPDNQLTTQYWFPWYNNVNMWTQLRFANPSTSLATNVKVYLGTQLLWSYDLAPMASVRKDFAGVNGGPLKIVSTQKVIAAERVIYSEGGVQRGVETSYSELMAIPDNKLYSSYVFPSYSYPDSSIWGQLRLANPSTTQSTTVKVYLGSELLATYNLGPSASLRTDYLGKDGGPLRVESTNGSIIAAMRVIMKVNGVDTSYSEIAGYPVNQLTGTYLFPWYNNYNFDTQFRIANP